MKKTFICTLAALILTFAFAVPALAEASPVYGAGTWPHWLYDFTFS